MGLLFISHKYIVIGMDNLILACLPSLPYKIHLTTLERLGHTYLYISKLYPATPIHEPKLKPRHRVWLIRLTGKDIVSTNKNYYCFIKFTLGLCPGLMKAVGYFMELTSVKQ